MTNMSCKCHFVVCIYVTSIKLFFAHFPCQWHACAHVTKEIFEMSLILLTNNN